MYHSTCVAANEARDINLLNCRIHHPAVPLRRGLIPARLSISTPSRQFSFHSNSVLVVRFRFKPLISITTFHSPPPTKAPHSPTQSTYNEARPLSLLPPFSPASRHQHAQSPPRPNRLNHNRNLASWPTPSNSGNNNHHRVRRVYHEILHHNTHSLYRRRGIRRHYELGYFHDRECLDDPAGV